MTTSLLKSYHHAISSHYIAFNIWEGQFASLVLSQVSFEWKSDKELSAAQF